MRDRHASSNYSHMCCMCCVRSHRPRRYNMEESSSRLAPSDSKRRSDAGARHAQPESKLQVACVAWADTQDLLVDGSPGGEAYRKGAHKARGCAPGRADLLVLEPGGDGAHGLAVELKIGRNDLSGQQRRWFARAEAKGWRVGVARSLAEFQKVVRDHMRSPHGSGSESDPFVFD